MTKYLRKYCDKYKVKKTENGDYEIFCSKGTISEYNQNGILLYYYEDKGKNTIRLKNFAIKKLKEFGLWYELHQDGDFEFTIMIKECDLDKWSIPLRIYKKRIISPEYREQLVDRMKMVRAMKM